MPTPPPAGAVVPAGGGRGHHNAKVHAWIHGSQPRWRRSRVEPRHSRWPWPECCRRRCSSTGVVAADRTLGARRSAELSTSSCPVQPCSCMRGGAGQPARPWAQMPSMDAASAAPLQDSQHGCDPTQHVHPPLRPTNASMHGTSATTPCVPRSPLGPALPQARVRPHPRCPPGHPPVADQPSPPQPQPPHPPVAPPQLALLARKRQTRSRRGVAACIASMHLATAPACPD